MNKRGVIIKRFINPSYSKYTRVPSSDGVFLSNQFSFVEYSTVNDHVQSSEFSLANLIAIGADKNMSYVCMSVNSDMNFVDEFAKSYSTITHVSEDNK